MEILRRSGGTWSHYRSYVETRITPKDLPSRSVIKDYNDLDWKSMEQQRYKKKEEAHNWELCVKRRHPGSSAWSRHALEALHQVGHSPQPIH